LTLTAIVARIYDSRTEQGTRPESGWLATRKAPPLVDERRRPTLRDVKPACGGTLVIEVPPLIF
jgi:hypothetical protein